MPIDTVVITGESLKKALPYSEIRVFLEYRNGDVYWLLETQFWNTLRLNGSEPRYWCWLWIRGYAHPLSGCPDLWKWSKSASGAHTVLPVSTWPSAALFGNPTVRLPKVDPCAASFVATVQTEAAHPFSPFVCTYILLLCKQNFPVRPTMQSCWCFHGTNPGTIPSNRFLCSRS